MEKAVDRQQRWRVLRMAIVRRPVKREKWPSGVWGASVAGNPENEGAVQSKMRWQCTAR
jgi:hypothetical protein